MTTFKEFLEVVITSVRHENRLHSELMEPSYHYIGLALIFADEEVSNTAMISVPSPAKLMILLAEGLAKKSSLDIGGGFLASESDY